LPELLIGQLGPRGHSLLHIAVDQQPVNVTLRGLLLHALAAQRWTLLCAVRIFAVALCAVVEEDALACSDRVFFPVVGVLSRVVFGGHLR